MREVYLDNSATTRISPEGAAAMHEVLEEVYGNPSSLHRLGVKAERKLKEAREILADILRVTPGEIFFTSGGTEASNLALLGAARRLSRRGRHLLTTVFEHPATLYACRALEEEGFQVEYLPVDREGRLDLEDLEAKIRRDTLLVSVMHVNNEVGTVLPVEDIGRIVKGKNPGCLFHVDAVQSFCRLECYPRRWRADLVSVSAHKIHGPKGAGALYKREGLPLQPLLYGGGQEGGLRSGTENTPGIAGFAAAAFSLYQNRRENARHLALLQEKFLEGTRARIPRARLNSPRDGTPHIVNLSFPGLKGEVLLHTLEQEGIYASTGSACHSRRQELSHVLAALGLNTEEIVGALRFSFSPFTTEEEIEYCLEKLAAAVAGLDTLGRRAGKQG
jgi:cysteine desulfurase